MPRIRSVHPEICEDEALATLDDPRAERTFVRLWTQLDDDGRAPGNPVLLSARLFPLQPSMTPKKVEEDLEKLEDAGLLLRYEADGKRWISAKPDSWSRWQSPRHPRPSKFPPPPNGVRSTAECRNGSANGREGPAGEGEGEEGKRAGSRPPSFETEFNETWALYPRQIARKDALGAYQARRRAGVTQEQLHRAVVNFADAMAAENRADDKIMHGSTFFGPNERWKDYEKASSSKREWFDE